MKDSVYTEVSKPIYNESTYQDCDFSLYTSSSHGKLFLVLDKILSNHTHDVAIYSINMPLVNEMDIRQSTTEEDTGNCWYIYVIGIILLALGGFVFYRLKCKNKKEETPAPKKIAENPAMTETGNTQNNWNRQSTRRHREEK